MDLLSSKPEKPWQSYQPLFKPSYCVYPKDNDTESLNSQCKEFLNLVEDKNTKETDIKRFIKLTTIFISRLRCLNCIILVITMHTSLKNLN